MMIKKSTNFTRQKSSFLSSLSFSRSYKGESHQTKVNAFRRREKEHEKKKNMKC
jgi:hypothetical protein